MAPRDPCEMSAAPLALPPPPPVREAVARRGRPSHQRTPPTHRRRPVAHPSFFCVDPPHRPIHPSKRMGMPTRETAPLAPPLDGVRPSRAAAPEHKRHPVRPVQVRAARAAMTTSPPAQTGRPSSDAAVAPARRRRAAIDLTSPPVTQAAHAAVAPSVAA